MTLCRTLALKLIGTKSYFIFTVNSCRTITSLKICSEFPDVDVSAVGSTYITTADGSMGVTVDVISSTSDHVALLKVIAIARLHISN